MNKSMASADEDSPSMTDEAKTAIAILSARISDVPATMAPKARRGFRVAATMDPAMRQEQVASMLSAFAAGLYPTSKELAEKIKLSTLEANDFSLAMSIVFGALIDIPATAKDFIELGRGKVFDDAEESTAFDIAKVIEEKRPELGTIFKRSSLTAAVLPSLEDFSLIVDIRIRFEGSALVESVPVAIVHVSTDAEGHEIWLQLNQAEVRMIADKLKKCDEQLQLAEQLLSAGRLK